MSEPDHDVDEASPERVVLVDDPLAATEAATYVRNYGTPHPIKEAEAE